MHSKFVLHLPNEILAIIINELALDTVDNDNDKGKILAALASCRLASHVLCSLATPLFFSSISLTDAYNNGSARGCSLFVKRATNLNNILATPNIAASIHSLSVTLYCKKRTLENSSSGAIMSAILSRLPHIQKFAFYADHHRGYASFPSLPTDFSAAIHEALCRSPNLTTLNLEGVEKFPFTTISACPNLRCLQLSRSNFAFDKLNSRDKISSSHLLQLESLEIDWDVIDFIGSRISRNVSFRNCFSQLRNLQLQDLFYKASCLSHGWDVMLLASQTLEKLEITGRQCWSIGLENMLASVPFDLGRFPALRHFKIEQTCSYPNNQALLRFLTSLLSIPSSPSGIEVLETRITWLNVEDGHGKDLFSSDAGWSTLDELFSSQRFVSLSKVVLCLELLVAGGVQVQALELERNLILTHVNDLFPLFRASNTQRTLEIHLKVRDYY